VLAELNAQLHKVTQNLQSGNLRVLSEDYAVETTLGAVSLTLDLVADYSIVHPTVRLRADPSIVRQNRELIAECELLIINILKKGV
jgi:hypothetical protein